MNSVIAVARRELRTFFASPIAYIVLGGFLLLSGWFYFGPLFVAFSLLPKIMVSFGDFERL